MKNLSSDFKKTIKLTFWIVLVPIIIALLGFIISGLINNFFYLQGFKSNIHSEELSSILKTVKPSLFLIIGCILAPITEEYIFRYPLLKFTLKQILFSISFYFIFKSFSNKNFLLNPVLINLNLLTLAIGISIFTFVSFSKFKILNIPISDKFKPIYIIISTLLFGFLHTYKLITINNLFSVQFFFLFTLTLPYILLGFYFVFLTRRFNFKYAVLSHILNNLKTFLIIYFTL